MKKIIFVTILLIIISIFTSCASEEYDSVNIERTALNDVKLTPFDSVIEFYSCTYLDTNCFFDFENTTPLGTKTYLRMPLSTDWFASVQSIHDDGELHNEKINSYILENYCEFFPYALNPEKILGYSANVESVYCSSVLPYSDELFIYYKTDNGNYLLFKEYEVSDKLYLFPLNEEFESISSMWHEAVLANASHDGGITLSMVTDISEYEITPRLLSWNAIVAIIVAVLAIGAITSLVIVKRKKKQGASTESQISSTAKN